MLWLPWAKLHLHASFCATLCRNKLLQRPLQCVVTAPALEWRQLCGIAPAKPSARPRVLFLDALHLADVHERIPKVAHSESLWLHHVRLWHLLLLLALPLPLTLLLLLLPWQPLLTLLQPQADFAAACAPHMHVLVSGIAIEVGTPLRRQTRRSTNHSEPMQTTSTRVCLIQSPRPNNQ